MNDSFIQVRTNEEDKQKAAEILAKLGTNLSTVINLLIRQIIETESIPFEMKLSHAEQNERDSAEIRCMTELFMPGDIVELIQNSEKTEDKLFYERLGDYILQAGQRLAIERNLY